MNDLLQDLWHDLREKRLWPIAALMLLGIVAIPAVLTESSADAPAPAAAPSATAERPKLDVALDTDAAVSSGTGSALDVFSADDPFSPPKGIAAKPATGATSASAAGASGEGKSAPSGGGESAPGSGGTPPTGPGTPVGPPRTTEYEYVADVTFWNGERRRTIRGLRKLDMLPNESAPALIFMGATSDGGDAVFLVDSTLSTTGEGRCSPAPDNCAFVAIGPGAEHLFSSESGESYRLRIDEIRKVKTGSAKSADAGKVRARAAVGASTEARRFSLPSLIDLVVETTEDEDGGSEDRSSATEAGR
jgi:hypothetical protein